MERSSAVPESTRVGAQLTLGNNELATISGGSFYGETAPTGPGGSLLLSGYDTAALNISGGIFSGPIGLDLNGASSATFTGTGLQFDSSTGMLTGTLADGSAIDDLIRLGGNYYISYGPDPGGGAGSITFDAAPSRRRL